MKTTPRFTAHSYQGYFWVCDHSKGENSPIESKRSIPIRFRSMESANKRADKLNSLESTKPDFHIVALSEDLSTWGIPADILTHITGVQGVYTYDSNEVTHCCEVTPSYWLYFLEYRAVGDDLYASEDEDLKDKVHNFFQDVRDESGGMYVHCHNLDSIVADLKGKPFRYYHAGDPFGDISADELETGYTRFDAIQEIWNTNLPL